MKIEDLKIQGLTSENAAFVDASHIITKDGRVFTYRRNWKKWSEQKKRPHSNGYLRGVIAGKDEYIHRLVAKAFVPNPRGLKEVNHKDGNKENNNADNLEWCTRSENNRHAFKTGLRNYEELKDMAKRPRPSLRKLTDEQVREIRRSTKSDRELAKIYNIARGPIWQIRTRRSYKEVV